MFLFLGLFSQGYAEFKVLAPLLMCLDVLFGAQHSMKLITLL